ncbi:helix-turn-helix transcriptional regulator [Granulosicoccaceae sp. 1_MG-2023]|nr:helix-turn-helix transcriptional regulator [Granulosicoccaceae sp. 1_MG-2023]
MKTSESTRLLLRNFGQRIRKERLALALSQSELGAKIGVTRYTVGALENGSDKVAIGTVIEAALAVGLPLSGTRHEDIGQVIGDAPLSQRIKLDDDYF